MKWWKPCVLISKKVFTAFSQTIPSLCMKLHTYSLLNMTQPLVPKSPYVWKTLVDEAVDRNSFKWKHVFQTLIPGQLSQGQSSTHTIIRIHIFTQISSQIITFPATIFDWNWHTNVEPDKWHTNVGPNNVSQGLFRKF